MHKSSDDGMEVFGGRPNFKHMIVTGAEDDSFDTDVGYKGNIQYAIAVQRAGGAVGDSIMEIDSDGDEDAVPRSEEHTSELQSLMRISYAVFCLKTNTQPPTLTTRRLTLSPHIYLSAPVHPDLTHHSPLHPP